MSKKMEAWTSYIFDLSDQSQISYDKTIQIINELEVSDSVKEMLIDAVDNLVIDVALQ